MKYIKAFISALILIVIDQATKCLAVRYLLPNGPFPLIEGVFELQYLENRGAAFGLMQNQKWLFIPMTIIIVGIVGWMYVKLPDTKRMLPLKMIAVAIIAGAIGNFIDRVTSGYVVDFLYFKLIDFPVFNVADIYVTVSAVIFLFLILVYYKDDDFDFLFKKKNK